MLGFDTNTKFIAWGMVDIHGDTETIKDYGTIKDGDSYIKELTELILTADMIFYEAFKFYSDVKINKYAIRAIERIGHIQALGLIHGKEVVGYERPDILKSLFGSQKVGKTASRRLLGVRVERCMIKVSQHTCDAFMVAIHGYYQTKRESDIKQNEVI